MQGVEFLCRGCEHISCEWQNATATDTHTEAHSYSHSYAHGIDRPCVAYLHTVDHMLCVNVHVFQPGLKD